MGILGGATESPMKGVEFVDEEGAKPSDSVLVGLGACRSRRGGGKSGAGPDFIRAIAPRVGSPRQQRDHVVAAEIGAASQHVPFGRQRSGRRPAAEVVSLV